MLNLSPLTEWRFHDTILVTGANVFIKTNKSKTSTGKTVTLKLELFLIY